MDQNHLCYHYTTGQISVRRRGDRLFEPSSCIAIGCLVGQVWLRRLSRRTLPRNCVHRHRAAHRTLDAALPPWQTRPRRGSRGQLREDPSARPVPSRLGHRRGRIGAPCEACWRSPRRPVDEGSRRIHRNAALSSTAGDPNFACSVAPFRTRMTRSPRNSPRTRNATLRQ